MIIDFLTVNVEQGIADESSRALSAETILADAIDEVRDESYAEVLYDASGKTINFYNADGDNIGSIDASDFVIDGMVENVSLSGNILTITFNTDSGKQDINIDLTQYFNPANYYTIQETDDAIEEQVASGISIANAYTDEAISHIDLSAYWTSAQTEQAINAVNDKFSGYSTTQEVEEMISSAVSDFVTSEDLATVEEVISVNVNTLADNLAALSGSVSDNYTPTSGFATINGSAITEGGDIIIEGGGASYSAGTNIDITNDVISVTGITIPDVSNFVTSADLATVEEVISVNVNTLADNLANNYSTTSQMNTAIENAIASESARTENTYLKEHQSLDAYWTSAQTKASISGVSVHLEEVENVTSIALNELNDKFSGYSTTQEVNELISSAITEVEAEIPTVPTNVSAFNNDAGYLTQHQSLSAYSTTQEIENMISSAVTDVEAEIPDVSDFVTSGDVETQITSKGYALSSSIPTATSDLTNDSNFVVSTAITSIIKLTQAEYDALAEKDNSTLYIIID